MLVFSPCLDCKHLFDKTENDSYFKCPSYPNGIPKEIFFDGSGSLCETENIDKTHFESCYNQF